MIFAYRHSSKHLSQGIFTSSFSHSRLPFQTLALYRYSSQMASLKQGLKKANDFLAFVDASPTPFHAVKTSKELLERAGFKCIKERDSWSSTLKPGGKYYLTRNSSSIVAFAIGNKWKAGNPISMIGAHTDSPCFRVKPISKRQSDGFLQVGVEHYGGMLAYTWFDRDLSVAGRVFVKKNDGTIVQELVRVKRPILRIPSLAIHLDRSDSFNPNKETQMYPIAGLVNAELNRRSKTVKESSEGKDTGAAKEALSSLKAPTERHHSYFVEVIAKEAGVRPEDIVDLEMVLYDTQPSAIGGLNEEFIFSPRLDNLMMSFCSVEGLIKSVESPLALEDETTTRLIALFDHEEVGSRSAQGALSNLLETTLHRLCLVNTTDNETQSPSTASRDDSSYDRISSADHDHSSTAFEQTLVTSFLVSADMAHSVHPNYPEKYEQNHRPEMNAGTVIKVNSQARYMTNTPGIVLIQQCAQRAAAATFEGAVSEGVPLQVFVVRNDSPCGGTIGPFLAAKLGTRTLDLGNAQLSMHSCRETCGAYDVEYAVNLFESFFKHYGQLEKTIIVD